MSLYQATEPFEEYLKNIFKYRKDYVDVIKQKYGNKSCSIINLQTLEIEECKDKRDGKIPRFGNLSEYYCEPAQELINEIQKFPGHTSLVCQQELSIHKNKKKNSHVSILIPRRTKRKETSCMLKGKEGSTGELTVGESIIETDSVTSDVDVISKAENPSLPLTHLHSSSRELSGCVKFKNNSTVLFESKTPESKSFTNKSLSDSHDTPKNKNLAVLDKQRKEKKGKNNRQRNFSNFIENKKENSDYSSVFLEISKKEETYPSLNRNAKKHALLKLNKSFGSKKLSFSQNNSSGYLTDDIPIDCLSLTKSSSKILDDNNKMVSLDIIDGDSPYSKNFISKQNVNTIKQVNCEENWSVNKSPCSKEGSSSFHVSHSNISSREYKRANKASLQSQRKKARENGMIVNSSDNDRPKSKELYTVNKHRKHKYISETEYTSIQVFFVKHAKKSCYIYNGQ